MYREYFDSLILYWNQASGQRSRHSAWWKGKKIGESTEESNKDNKRSRKHDYEKNCNNWDIQLRKKKTWEETWQQFSHV